MKKVVWNEKWKPYAAWIEEQLAVHEMTPTDWCRLAGIHPSTLLRPMHTEGYTAGPSQSTISALAGAINAPMPYPAGQRLPMKSLSEITKLYASTGVSVKSVIDEGEFHLLTLELRVPKAA